MGVVLSVRPHASGCGPPSFRLELNGWLVTRFSLLDPLCLLPCDLCLQRSLFRLSPFAKRRIILGAVNLSAIRALIEHRAGGEPAIAAMSDQTYNAVSCEAR
jgi:hypothetical protein